MELVLFFSPSVEPVHLEPRYQENRALILSDYILDLGSRTKTSLDWWSETKVSRALCRTHAALD